MRINREDKNLIRIDAREFDNGGNAMLYLERPAGFDLLAHII